MGKIRVIAGDKDEVVFDDLKDLDQAFHLAHLVANATGWDSVSVVYPKKVNGLVCTVGNRVLPKRLAPGAAYRAVRLDEIQGKVTAFARQILVRGGQLIL